jgi:hypothetical protein
VDAVERDARESAEEELLEAIPDAYSSAQRPPAVSLSETRVNIDYDKIDDSSGQVSSCFEYVDVSGCGAARAGGGSCGDFDSDGDPEIVDEKPVRATSVTIDVHTGRAGFTLTDDRYEIPVESGWESLEFRVQGANSYSHDFRPGQEAGPAGSPVDVRVSDLAAYTGR